VADDAADDDGSDDANDDWDNFDPTGDPTRAPVADDDSDDADDGSESFDPTTAPTGKPTTAPSQPFPTPTPKPSAVPTPRPSSAPTPTPTPKPSETPSAVPTPRPSSSAPTNSPTMGFVESGFKDGDGDFTLEDDGAACDDEPTKKWSKKEKSCEGKRAWIEENKKDACKKNAAWVSDGICRQTCWELGSKYAYDYCGAEAEDDSVVSACVDEPTKKWAKKGESCQDKLVWIVKNNKDVCKKNVDWIAKKTCEQTCSDLGSKFAYRDCDGDLEEAAVGCAALTSKSTCTIMAPCCAWSKKTCSSTGECVL